MNFDTPDCAFKMVRARALIHLEGLLLLLHFDYLLIRDSDLDTQYYDVRSYRSAFAKTVSKKAHLPVVLLVIGLAKSNFDDVKSCFDEYDDY